MRVLVATTGGEGHFQPLVPLARACLARGHDVHVIGPESLSSTLVASGFAVTVGPAPPPENAAELWGRVATMTRADAGEVVEREWFATQCANALLPAVAHVVSAWNPSVVIRDTCEYASAIVASRNGIPRIQVGISTARIEAGVLTTLVRPDLDQHVADLSDELFLDPYLTRFPASLDPSSYPRTVRYRVPAPSNEPVSDFWHGSTAPLVYLTFGTVALRDPSARDVFRETLRSLAARDCRVLATTNGQVDCDDIARSHANVHVERWYPHDRVLAQCALVVSHGGSGTTYAALAAGVAQVIIPLFADQGTNGALIAHAGAGIVVGDGSRSAPENAAAASSREIDRAIDEVLTRREFAHHARRLGDEMNSHADVATVLEQLFGVDA